MPEIVVECPSGLSGRVRGLKARELNYLSDRRSVRSGEALDRIMEACWVETLDTGPYTFEGPPNWDDILQADRFTVLLKVRVATYPDEPYPFDVICQSEACKTKIEWEIDLETDLKSEPLPESSIKRVKANKLFEVELGDQTIYWRMTTGAMEKRATKRKAAPSFTQMLAMRIVRVGDDMEQPRKIEQWLEDQEMSECRNLLQAFEAAEGGIDTSIDIECNTCGLEQDVDLPFSAEFFMPRVDRKNSKTAVKARKKKARRTRTG